MKNTLLLLSAAALSLASSAFAQTLIEEDFEKPTGVTLFYPPPSGEPYKKFSKNFTAWANNDGQIAVTYAEKAGESDSGAVVCKVARPSSGGYLALNCEGIKIPVSGIDQVAAAIKTFQIEFSIKAPSSQKVNLFLGPDTAMFPADPALKDEYKSRSFSSRIVFPAIPGTDEFTKYTLKASDLSDTDMEKLTELAMDCVKNGASEIDLNFSWFLFGASWPEGSEFTVDNVKVSLVQ